MALDILQMAIVIALIVLLAIPTGRYMAAVLMRRKTFADRVLDPVDHAIYRVGGVNPDEGMRWPASFSYSWSSPT